MKAHTLLEQPEAGGALLLLNLRRASRVRAGLHTKAVSDCAHRGIDLLS